MVAMFVELLKTILVSCMKIRGDENSWVFTIRYSTYHDGIWTKCEGMVWGGYLEEVIDCVDDHLYSPGFYLVSVEYDPEHYKNVKGYSFYKL